MSCNVDDTNENIGLEYLISTKRCNEYIKIRAEKILEIHQNISIEFIDFSKHNNELWSIAGIYVIKPTGIGEIGSSDVLQILSNICTESISEYPASKLIDIDYLDKLNQLIGVSGESNDDGYKFYMYSGDSDKIYIHRSLVSDRI